jgi:hypothetical protein
LEAEPFPETYQEYKTEEGGVVSLLLSLVDSEAGRRALAEELPREVLNAATGGSTVTISRHGFANGRACLKCLYQFAGTAPSTDELYARDLGLSVEEVAELLATNRGMDRATLRKIEQARKLPPFELEGQLGAQLQSMYQRVVCGDAAVSTPSGTVLSPLPFISAGGGVLLAAELIKASDLQLRPFLLDNYFRYDALRNINPDMKMTKAPRAICICSNEDYIQAYRQKYADRRDAP